METNENELNMDKEEMKKIFSFALGQIFKHAEEKRKKEEAKKTNQRRFEETGVMTLTENEYGVFVWMPNECQAIN